MNKTTQNELVRVSCGEAEAEGHDEGGFFRMKEVESTPPQIKRRMRRCGGCHDDFYNYRANCTGNHCWSLTHDENFRGKGRPKCFH